MGFVVAAVKAVAAIVAKSAIAKTVVKLAATALISKVATKSISKLIAKRDGVQAASGGDAGGRVQLPPATDNKLPIVYGTAWLGGPIIDAKISVDQKYMWYVVALCEKPDSTTIQFDVTNGVYYGGKKVSYGPNGVVNSLITNSDPPQSDTKVAGKIYIWLFQNGANSSGINSGGLTPNQIMSDATTGGGIPVNERWNGPIYTSNGQSVQMNDMVFAIVRVEYNTDASTTSLDTLQVKVTNNMGSTNGCRPGTAILDYMTNERYGCAIPLENVDTSSLNSLNTYSNEYIDYIDVNGNPQTQPYRYRVNGPLDTGNPCLTNLQFLADTADSWIQYTETSGKWRIVPNKPYTGSLASLYNVNDNVLLGGIQINPIDLNDTYNQVEVAYPNTNVKDQTDYQIVDLTDPTTAWFPIYNQVLSPNEAINRLNIALPLVNSAVQAKYLAVRRLLQSREDLVITCLLDYSGIQIDAGDVIRVNHNAYGWTDKLFRVSAVSEVQDESGNLTAQIEAFEYNDAIYADNAIQDFVPADNTGLTDPNVISPPCNPAVNLLTSDETLITGFQVVSCVPDTGTVIYMDFNYGLDGNVANHQLYRTVQSAGGLPFTNSDSANGLYNFIDISVNDLPAASYYWSCTARNDTAGRSSDTSAVFNWGGANVQPFNPDTLRGGLTGNQYRPNSVGYLTCGNSMIALQLICSDGYQMAPNPFGNVTQPVDLANLNVLQIGVPVYLNGTDVTSNLYYPYVSNTSTTANGYYANSTAPFEPAGATYIARYQGDNDWYLFTGGPFANAVINGYEFMRSEIETQIVTDAPTTIQLLPMSTGSGFGGLFLGSDAALQTIELPQANVPYYIDTNWETIPSGYNPIFGGIFIRNMNANANIVIVSNQLYIYKGKL